MSLIEIVAPRPKLADLVAAIQDFGSLQFEEVPLVVAGARSYLHRDQLSDEEIDEQKKLTDVQQSLEEMRAQLYDAFQPEEADIQAARLELKGSGADYLLLTTSRLKRKLSNYIRKRANIKSDIKSLGNYGRRLDDLTGLLSGVRSSEDIAHWALMVGSADQHEFNIMIENLKRVTQNTGKVLQTQATEKERRGTDVVLVTAPAEYTTAVRRLIDECSLSELRLPMAVRSLPLPAAVEHLQKQGMDLPSRLEKIEEDLDAFKHEHQGVLAAIERICADTLARLAVVENMAHSEMLCVSHAWIPSEDIDRLRQALQAKVDPCVVVTELRDMAGQSQNVPVRLENSKAFRPFEKLLNLFSVPLYGSFDPTVLMAVVFPLFFGLILGDIGYGLILLALTLWARRRWRHLPMMGDIAAIAIWCSAASVLFGIIFGEVLGDLGHRIGLVPLVVGGVRLLPIWESREVIIDELLVVSIIIGFVHVTLGLLIGIFESVRMRNQHHLRESLGLLAGLLGLVVLLAPLPPEWIPAGVRKAIGGVVLIGGATTLVINSGAAGPIEIVSLVANVFSYCRLMALGVAGMVLANLANSVAAGQANIIVGILISLPIHILAIALGILEPTIHALRLHYVEFLPKFFIGDGREYTPLRRKGRPDDE
ncbi:MAG: hypothetical protein HQ523_01770 [Lentisphaerae bacterium]|nr:hypothetical protein [Lentisphaerota bacterium]